MSRWVIKLVGINRYYRRGPVTHWTGLDQATAFPSMSEALLESPAGYRVVLKEV